MNDLAEKALRGMDRARRQIAARPVLALAPGGFVLASVIVVTGGRIGAARAAVPIDRWLGLLSEAGYRVTGVAMGAVMLAAISALIGLWLLTLRVGRSRVFTQREVWTIAAAWAAPFLVGPPVLSTDVYGYVARGLLARQGLSPYHHGATALGDVRIVDAIDPIWRSARSTDGPLASLLEHLAVSVTGGRVLATIIVCRVGAAVSIVVIGRLAAQLAGPRRSSTALCLTVLNPAVLIFVGSAALYTGALVALLLATLVAASQRRWARAVVLACLAAGLRPVALLVVPAVIAAHALRHRGSGGWRTAVRDGVLAACALAVIALCVPFGLGWIANLGSAAREHVPFAPSSVIGAVVGFIVPSASFDDLAVGGRIAAGFAGATAIGYLFATIRSRPLERTVGYALLAAGILAPVVYPPFLLWGALCLAPTAVATRRDCVIALSCVACVLAPVGLGENGGHYATIGALALIALVLVPRLLDRQRNRLVTSPRVSADG
jgi:alpha-1,6-mannosyltransferase